MKRTTLLKRSPLKRTRKPLPKVKKTSISKMKAKAWSAFSKYIRLHYADSTGHVTCYTCDTYLSWKSAQAGHGIAGRSSAVLFVEEIVRPQCIGCNVFQHGRLDVFAAKLIKELGLLRYEELLQSKGIPLKYTLQDYQGIYEHYKEADDFEGM